MTELEAIRDELAELRRRVGELERKALPVYDHEAGKFPGQQPSPTLVPQRLSPTVAPGGWPYTSTTYGTGKGLEECGRN